MKLRLVIDRMAVDARLLPRRERAGLAASLQQTLEGLVRQQLAARLLPAARNVAGERVGVALPPAADGARIGQAVGAAIVAQAWGGQERQGTP